MIEEQAKGCAKRKPLVAREKLACIAKECRRGRYPDYLQARMHGLSILA